MTLKPDASVHFINCQQGNMTLIVTPSQVVVYDCRIVADNEERILNHLKAYIPPRKASDGEPTKWIDWFICSHRDRDHIQGLEILNKNFPIRGIVDPGTNSGSTEGNENRYYMGLRRRLTEKIGSQAVHVPCPSSDPSPIFSNDPGVKFYCLCSGKNDSPSEDGHYGNNVFQVDLYGNRVLLTGDSDWRSWKERILPRFKDTGLLKTTVLVASHHGSRSFFVCSDNDVDEEEAWTKAFDEHLSSIKPVMTVISCGPQDVHNHPNETAYRKYLEATKFHQVNLTREKGTMIGQFQRNGRWTVTPATFLSGWDYRRSKANASVNLRCWKYKNGSYVGEVANGDSVAVGHELRFKAHTSGGFEPHKTDFVFEVSNGGSGSDSDHDEIYFKSASERGQDPCGFKRDLQYVGTHLLRCCAQLKGSDTWAQDVFVVNGVPA